MSNHTKIKAAETANYDNRTDDKWREITGTLQPGDKMTVDVDDPPALIRTDETTTANTIYVGAAAMGTATSAAAWQITRIVTSGGNIVQTWADGDSAADNIWDNRASLSYS